MKKEICTQCHLEDNHPRVLRVKVAKEIVDKQFNF